MSASPPMLECCYTRAKRRRMAKQTRITIISGFLGSGKTTLLKRFLDWEFDRGSKPQVIMSEFGDFDIDGQIIADERLQVAAVTGGCVCCTNRDELKNAIARIVRAAPGSPLYIETTGVADPAGVIQTVTPFTAKGDVILRPVLVVYDANQHGKGDRDAILIEKQLMAADWIVLNKSDLVQVGMIAILDDIAAVNPLAKVVPTVHCDIDLAQATAGTTSVFSAGADAGTSTENYRSLAFKLEARLSRPPFEKWLNSLPPEVVRLKGFVRFAGENGIFEVQKSRGQADIAPFQTVRWMDATLVAITHPMPANNLVKSLAACIEPEEKPSRTE